MELPQPRRYRTRVFFDGGEVLTHRSYLAVLDLTAGPGLAAAKGQLDALLQSIAYDHGARGERVRLYHLLVEDWDTRTPVCHWPALSWPETR